MKTFATTSVEQVSQPRHCRKVSGWRTPPVIGTGATCSSMRAAYAVTPSSGVNQPTKRAKGSGGSNQPISIVAALQPGQVNEPVAGVFQPGEGNAGPKMS